MSGGDRNMAGIETNVSRTVAANVRKLRRAREWSQDALAERVAMAGMPNLDRQKISKAERGNRATFSVDELVALAAALDVRPEELLTPFECSQCHNTPPAGFTCMTCGARS